MSYAKVDHAEWVQLQIAPSKRRLSPKAAKSSRGWAAAPDTLSAFQCRAFDILGMTFGGIYNAPISWNAVDWRAGSGNRRVLSLPDVALCATPAMGGRAETWLCAFESEYG
jgi:hypothetical protein